MKSKRFKILLELFTTFMRIGAFTFGGGLAMLPILRREVVENKKWTNDEDLIDYYSIGQMTPGIIALNVSTIIGNKKAGKIGAIVAVTGFLLPAFLIIIVLSSLIFKYSEEEIVKHAFSGIRIAVSALIAHTVIKLARIGVVDKITGLIFFLSFVMIAFFKFSPIPIVFLSAFTGIIYRMRNKK
ncbi:MAG: chromate transporter [Tissierellia bacterium]|nr:chromate transporter [Tissierellia bacterium]